MKQLIKRLVTKFPVVDRAIRASMQPYRKYLDKTQQKKYLEWESSRAMPDSELQEHCRQSDNLDIKPLVSVIVPLYNTPQGFFWEMVQSVLDQTYDNWELVLVDDASPEVAVRSNMQQAALKDKRIKTVLLDTNHHIAGATNEGINASTGTYIALLDHDDILHPDALYQVVSVINRNPNAGLIYTDEAKLDSGGKPYQPFFKPDWNFDMLRSINYITHFTTIKKDVIGRVGGEDGSYNGTQDWELFLRVTRALKPQQIEHVPQVLYYWRVHRASTAGNLDAKPYVLDAQRKALQEDIAQRGINAKVTRDPLYGAQWRVEYNGLEPAPSIRVISPNGTVGDVLRGIREDYVVIADAAVATSGEAFRQLVAEAGQDDIGAVAPAIGDEQVLLDNLKAILPVETVRFIKSLSRRSFARHTYTTTRYSLPWLKAPVLVVQVKKLHGISPKTSLESRTLSTELAKRGYRNVYNSYVKC